MTIELNVDEILSLPYTINKRGYAFVRFLGLLFRRYHLVVIASGGTIKPGQIVHHRDENKLNDQPGNLEVLWPGAHISLHKLGNTYFKNRKHREETKRLMAVAALGNQRFLGKEHSAETKLKISEKLQGHGFSEATIDKMRESARRRGFAGDEETRRKLTDAASRRINKHGSCSICGKIGKFAKTHGKPGH